MTHKFSLRIYYEDTDAGGVVYYANYLKFAERARTEMLRDTGIMQSELRDEHKVLFVVRHAAIDYLKPAQLDDELIIETALVESRNVSFVLKQGIYNSDDVLLAAIDVTIVCVNENLAPSPLPEAVKSVLQTHYQN